MNEVLKKDEKCRKRYMKSHKVLSLILDNEKDADILRWLGYQDNRSEAVRNAIREKISRLPVPS